MRKKKIGNALLAFTAAAMVLTVKVGSTDAYFTTYVEAQGSATVHLGDETNIREEVSGWEKTLAVDNKEGSEPVYVRARAFVGDQYGLTYNGNDWVEASDGFWVYTGIVEGGKSTTDLKITVSAKEKKNSFDVTVIYESIPVQYDEEGDILQPVVDGKENPEIDWNKKLDVIESKPKGEIVDTLEPDESKNPATPSDSTQEPDQTSSETEPESSTEQDTESDNGGEG